MTFLKQFEAELALKLDGAEDTATIVRWVSEKVLESYRNGISRELALFASRNGVF